MASARTGNRTGRSLERSVAEIIEIAGYRLVERSTLFWAMREVAQPIYAAQVETGHDIYGKRRRVDFVLYHPQRWPGCLVIQCKWQASRGSVDEKYPYEVLNIQMGEYPTIIVLDGSGYSPGSATWLRGQQGKNQLRHVHDLGQFQRFASRGSL